MVFIAINNEWRTRDPVREYEIKKEETTRSVLTKEDVYKRQQQTLDLAKQTLPEILESAEKNGTTDRCV